jgi:hypothetical protein
MRKRNLQTAVTHYIKKFVFVFRKELIWERDIYKQQSLSTYSFLKTKKYYDVVSDCCLYMSLSQISSFLKTKKILWCREWLLFNAKSALFLLYHYKNKLHFNENMSDLPQYGDTTFCIRHLVSNRWLSLISKENIPSVR